MGRDVVVAVLKAFKMMDDMNASQRNLEQMVTYGRDLYCKGNKDLMKKWPTTWAGCMKVLKDAGYREPVTYYFCLSEHHPCLWSSLPSHIDECCYCGKPGTIEFPYLRLPHKVKQWCSSAAFCHKMTAHWRNKSSWLYGTNSSSTKN